MITFKEIEIVGLFGESDVHIPIRDNRIILVGYNGIGKSTILNIFYFFISQQWHKLGEQDFSSVSLRLKNKNKKLVIKKTELIEYIELQRRERRGSRWGHQFRPSLLKEAYDLISRRSRHTDARIATSVPRSSLQRDIGYLSEELGVPLRVADEILREIRYMTKREFEFDSKAQENVAAVDEFLSENLEGRILYLPTYRRIEKDIKTVFPEIEEELQRKLSRRRHSNFKSENYIELVQFGMEDVKENLANRLENVKAHALSQINSLTTKYLRDVIRDEAKQYDEEATSRISENALNSVFSKVDSAILSVQPETN